MGQRQSAMADKLMQLLRENWIVIGGIAAATWTFFQFINNRSIPFNVSVDLATTIEQRSKRDLTAAADAKRAIPVTVKVAVENESDWRELRIQDPAWVAYGFRLAAPADARGQATRQITPSEMQTRINQAFAGNGDPTSAINAIGDRRLLHYSYSKELIGSGLLLGDEDIKPRETISTQLIVPVAANTYDFVQIRAFVPTLSQGQRNKRFGARLIIADQKHGQEPQLLFCIKEGQRCRPLQQGESQPSGGQIHSTVSELWLGKAES